MSGSKTIKYLTVGDIIRSENFANGYYARNEENPFIPRISFNGGKPFSYNGRCDGDKAPANDPERGKLWYCVEKVEQRHASCISGHYKKGGVLITAVGLNGMNEPDPQIGGRIIIDLDDKELSDRGPSVEYWGTMQRGAYPDRLPFEGPRDPLGLDWLETLCFRPFL